MEDDSNPDATPDQLFRVQLETMTRQAVRTRVFLTIWWTYAGPSRGAFLEATAQYREFFMFDQNAHETAWVVNLYRLIERRNDSRNLSTLLNAAKEVGVDTKSLEAKLANLRKLPVSTGLKRIRHKVVAHRDLSSDYSQLWRDAGLRYEDLECLIGRILEIINALRRHCGLSNASLRTSPIDDLKKLIQALSEANSGAQ